MKLNWFSPLPPAKTDIAHFTLRVLATLREHAEVTLWTDQTTWDKTLDEHARVRSFQLESVPWVEINRGDMSIYNLGNNPDYHGAIWEVSQRHPGIVIAHDYSLQELFYGLYHAHWHDLEAYLTQMEFYYGAQGRRDAQECYTSDGRDMPEMTARYPLTQLALENALGLVVHTEAAFDQLRDKIPCPITYAPLPFATEHALDQLSISSNRLNRPPYRLIVFGYLGRNRRLSAVLKALAALPEREQFRLDIYGELMNESEVNAEILAHALQPLVSVRGFVPEAELERSLASAHLALNLRYPTMGEASASQLRIWSHALPSLVTEVGWYATLPTDAVAFVRPAQEVEDITDHLRAFLSDPSRFAAMGRRGRRLYEEQHQPEQYVESLLEVISEAQNFRPLAAFQRAEARAEAEKKRWLPTTFEDEARLNLIARKGQLLYGRTRPENRLSAPREFVETQGRSLLRRAKRFVKRRLLKRI